MTDELLDRLRAANPLPGGSTAPPVDEILGSLNVRSPRAPRRGRPITLLAPVLAAAVAALVLLVALTTLRGGHHSAHTSTRPPVPTSTPGAPKGGMRGLVTVWGAGFSTASNGVISLQQCLGCRNGNQTAHSTDRYWLVSTTNGGVSWSLQPRRYYIQQPLFAGADGWAGGLQTTGNQAGGIAQYYVTHDGGQSWRVAPAAAPNEGGALVSLAGGEVWATGVTPTNVAILHAPVTSNRLNATASQPIHGSWTNVEVIAAGPGTAYVANGDAPRQTFVTHDDGRSWQRVAPPCPQGDRGVPTSAYGDTVWAICSSTHSQRSELARSTNGGRSWQPLNAPMPTNGVQPVSARVAWMLAGRGQVWRTTDAGLTWRTVWSAVSSEPTSLRTHAPAIAAGASSLPRLIAQSPTSASVLTLLTRGHEGQQATLTNLVLYRTSDGGRNWRPYPVPLGQR